LAVQAALWLSIPTLDQTQKNALAGLQVAYQSANASQKAAIDMVVQGGLPQMAQNAYMEKNGERMLDGLQKGVDDGLIDKDTAKKIAGDYFSRSLGGNPLADGVLPSGKPDTKGYKEAAKGIEDIARKEKWSPERKEKELDVLKKQYNIGTGGEQQTAVSPLQEQQGNFVGHLNQVKDIIASMQGNPAGVNSLIGILAGKDDNLSAMLSELLQTYANKDLLAGDDFGSNTNNLA
jgi:hypothetical protein